MTRVRLPHVPRPWLQPIKMLSAAALALLIAVTMITTVLATPDDDQSPPQYATQITGHLPPPGTAGSAVVRWGGGTLLQLFTRLAVNGCQPSSFWIWDPDVEKYSEPYFLEGKPTWNSDFTQRFGEYVPATHLWVECIDMLNLIFGHNSLTPDEREHARQQAAPDSYSLADGAVVTRDCGTHWSPIVVDRVLPVLPTEQGLCVIRFRGKGLEGHGESTSFFSQGLKFLTFKNTSHTYVAYQHHSIVALHESQAQYDERMRIEIHELCHAHQAWYKMTFLTVSGILTNPDALRTYLGDMSETPYMESFVRAVGFTRTASGQWTLPDDSPLRGTYGDDDPKELSANVCAFYLMKRLDIHGGVYNDDTLDKYLSTELLNWVEEHVLVLPEAHSIANANRLRLEGSTDVYQVKLVGKKKFKRLILSPPPLHSSALRHRGYAEESWLDRRPPPFVHVVDSKEFASFTTSQLIKESGSDWWWHQTKVGPNSGTKHLITTPLREEAGLDEDAVFEVAPGMLHRWETGRGALLGDLAP